MAKKRRKNTPTDIIGTSVAFQVGSGVTGTLQSNVGNANTQPITNLGMSGMRIGSLGTIAMGANYTMDKVRKINGKKRRKR